LIERKGEKFLEMALGGQKFFLEQWKKNEKKKSSIRAALKEIPSNPFRR